MKSTSLLSAAFLAGTATAKTVFTQFAVNGVDQGYTVGLRVPSSNAAITDITSPNIICNTGYIQPVSQTVVKVKAGDQITAMFHRTSAGAVGADAFEPLDPTNKGPVIAYMAAVPSATQTTVTGEYNYPDHSLKWFKVWQDGYDTTTHQWGSDKLFVNKGNATFNLPTCIASGKYLLRMESIGLQQATSYPGAQFYMGCAQLDVAGSSSPLVPNTVSFPGAYRSNDLGIVTSIFGVSSYTPPGPAVFRC
ncbi:glycoside hydrolase family 61 protein G [Panaeolus papilionaceus]|nr:glycoside hydrolase family 61 protein G [Panaeolus papilionaceus]